MKTRSISDFLNKEVTEYAFDVIESRAIPSVIDGLKPTARKVIYIADKKWKSTSDKPMKVFQLTGAVAEQSYYHHGDQSLNSCITNMGQKFKNNMTLLEGIGQYGSLRSPSAGAPRYISTKLSSNFRLLYKDFELLENQVFEGHVIEPKFFIPIIPTVIVNGSSGIAVGFASNIFNRNPKDVIDACICYLNGKKVKELKPWLNEFSGTFTRDPINKNKWNIRGIYEIVNTTNVHVTELPPDITFEKYESYLDSLVDKKKIVDYDNNSSANVDYIIKFRRDYLAELISNGGLESLLKIESSDTENITTIDENGKLKIFESVEDIIPYFVDFRLKMYTKRKEYLINKYTYEYNMLKYKSLFIKAIIDKKLNVNNTPKEKIIEYLDENKFLKIEDNYDYLLRMPIYSLTKEKFQELVLQCKERKENIEAVKAMKEIEMYNEDLKELKSKIK